MTDAQREPWWDRRIVVPLAVALAAVPLLYPRLPPLVDLLGHVGRYAVMLDGGRSPDLARFYAFHWSPGGNLGVDVLVWLLSPLIGLEPAVKFVILLIPPLTVAGFLWVAREAHGRIPPTAYFAVPFALSQPFLYGFANYTLSMALAFLALGLWLRLGRTERTRLRTWLFVPISLTVYFTHAFGWGVLGLMVFATELAGRRERGEPWPRALWRAGWTAAGLALPLLAILLWQSGAAQGHTADWFLVNVKLIWLVSALRDRWAILDQLSVLLVLYVIGVAALSAKFGFERRLLAAGLLLVAAFLIVPRIVFDSAYADMRLIPYALATLVLAVRPTEACGPRLLRWVALAAFGFIAVRAATTTASLALASDRLEAQAAALDNVPTGARVVSLSGMGCNDAVWALQRNLHLGALVIARRNGFSNDQWDLPGLNLRILYRAPGRFAYAPSQGVRPNGCGDGFYLTIDEALRDLPRPAFDYLWLIDTPPFDQRLLGGLRPVWTGPGTALYRLPPSARPQPKAAP